MSGYTQTGLPFSGSTPISRHTSWQAAQAAARGRGQKTRAYLRHLHAQGATGATDHEAAVALGFPLQSICSIRNTAVHCGLVRPSGATRPSPYGHACAVWVVTDQYRED